jgi:hypothetical protein
MEVDWEHSFPEPPVGPQPDYSRAALARFIEFVVAKGLVHPATAQGWRVATAKVLEELSAEELADVRRIDVERTFKEFLNRYPGRLSPASVGEYRRRVSRAIEEFVRRRLDVTPVAGPMPIRARPGSPVQARTADGIALEYPLRPDLLAHVVVPRDLTVEEARRMGAFLVTLAVDFRASS